VTSRALYRPDELLAVDRLLVVDTNSWRLHHATSMEIALAARERGSKVRYVNLRERLPAVEDATWLPRALDLSTMRIRRARRLLRAQGIELGEPAADPQELPRARLAARRMLEGCADTAALTRLAHGSFADIGWGVLSSVVEVTRNPFASLRAYRALFEDFLTSALLVHELSRRAIEDFAPDAVVLFNGRFASTRPILAAARAAGVRALIHERGCDKDHYWLATEPIHDPDYVQRCIREFWRPELAAAGEEFFRGRRDRVERAWRSFTRDQVAGRIPAPMQAGRWVAFFTTSEDEYVAIGDQYANPAFPAQIDAVRAVAGIAQRAGARLCVRVHPNISSKGREQIDFWRRLEIPGGIVVGAEERYDSYAILDRAEVVCSYGSTVGIEATYWGKPSLLLGRSIYDRLGAAFNAGGAAEIASFLEKPTVFPRDGALMYGAFFARFGTRYRHYQADDLFIGRILGTYLDPLPVRLLRAAARNLRA
jgi:hypothetical protein